MKLEKAIIPAIIAKSQEGLDERINIVKEFVSLVQLDVMDGKFVPNTSLDFDFTLPKASCQFEAHLMINNPMEWIEKNYGKVDTILAHFESCNNPKEIIRFARDKRKKVGFALNPETSVQKISEYLGEIDQLLIMTVNPGFYGSPFLPETLKKIKELRTLMPDLDIEVDGGIIPSTIESVDKAGANMFVSGSYIIEAANIKEAIDTLKKQLNQ